MRPEMFKFPLLLLLICSTRSQANSNRSPLTFEELRTVLTKPHVVEAIARTLAACHDCGPSGNSDPIIAIAAQVSERGHHSGRNFRADIPPNVEFLPEVSLERPPARKNHWNRSNNNQRPSNHHNNQPNKPPNQPNQGNHDRERSSSGRGQQGGSVAGGNSRSNPPRRSKYKENQVCECD